MYKNSTRCILLVASIFYFSSSSSSFAMEEADERNIITITQPLILIEEDKQFRTATEQFIEGHPAYLRGWKIKKIYNHPTKEFLLSDKRCFKMIPVFPGGDDEFAKEVKRLGDQQCMKGNWVTINHWYFANQNLSFNINRIQQQSREMARL